jgi:hypothetical protein
MECFSVISGPKSVIHSMYSRLLIECLELRRLASISEIDDAWQRILKDEEE